MRPRIEITLTVDEDISRAEVEDVLRFAFDGQPDGQAKVCITGGAIAGGLVLLVDRHEWQVTERGEN